MASGPGTGPAPPCPKEDPAPSARLSGSPGPSALPSESSVPLDHAGKLGAPFLLPSDLHFTTPDHAGPRSLTRAAPSGTPSCRLGVSQWSASCCGEWVWGGVAVSQAGLVPAVCRSEPWGSLLPGKRDSAGCDSQRGLRPSSGVLGRSRLPPGQGNEHQPTLPFSGPDCSPETRRGWEETGSDLGRSAASRGPGSSSARWGLWEGPAGPQRAGEEWQQPSAWALARGTLPLPSPVGGGQGLRQLPQGAGCPLALEGPGGTPGGHLGRAKVVRKGQVWGTGRRGRRGTVLGALLGRGQPGERASPRVPEPGPQQPWRQTDGRDTSLAPTHPRTHTNIQT